MPNASKSLLQYEAGRTLYDYAALTRDTGSIFSRSDATLWSKYLGAEPIIRPNGLISGGVVSVDAAAANDQVDVSASTCYLAGVLTSVAEDLSNAITRPATAVAKINSITITSAGAVAVVAGTDGATTAFSETRGAAGGPPWIPTTSIEIAQVRVISNTSAPITADEIFQVIGQHRETWDYPAWTEYPLGNKTRNAHIEFYADLPLIHSDDAGTTTAPKKVYARVYAPTLADIPLADEFKAAEVTHSVSSKPVYNQKTVASSSSSLGQSSFTVYLKDAVTDAFLSNKDQVIVVKYLPNKYGTSYHLEQGTLGIARSWPSGDSISASCTLSPEQEGVDRVS